MPAAEWWPLLEVAPGVPLAEEAEPEPEEQKFEELARERLVLEPAEARLAEQSSRIATRDSRPDPVS